MNRMSILRGLLLFRAKLSYVGWFKEQSDGTNDDFELEGYESHEHIKGLVAV